MLVGCGQTVKKIRGNDYIYFWWYERTDGKSVQRYAYIGREDDPEARRKAARMSLDYCIRAREKLDASIDSLSGKI
ncbi:MAG: hypothetical protein ACE5QF_02170 [Thermoplasmata archaeon]